jgi:hypothetical protein
MLQTFANSGGSGEIRKCGGRTGFARALRMASRELAEAIEVRSPAVSDHAIGSAHVGTRGAAARRRRRLRLRLDLSIRPRWTGVLDHAGRAFRVEPTGRGVPSGSPRHRRQASAVLVTGAVGDPGNRALHVGHVGEHQHIEQSDSVIWGAIFDFVQDIGGATENVGHLRFALGERFLVSARRFPLQSADATRREIESGRRIDAPAALFETIVERSSMR